MIVNQGRLSTRCGLSRCGKRPFAAHAVRPGARPVHRRIGEARPGEPRDIHREIGAAEREVDQPAPGVQEVTPAMLLEAVETIAATVKTILNGCQRVEVEEIVSADAQELAQACAV